MISGFINRVDRADRAGAAVLLVLVLLCSGCGSPQDLSSGVQGSAKERTDEERYRYEGTGKAKQKTLIRRQDERFKALLEADKKKG